MGSSQNFASKDGKINVFDRFKSQIRKQRITDVAVENCFYDVDFDKMTKYLEPEEELKVKSQIMEILKVGSWNDAIKALDPKYIEKQFSKIEDRYSKLLQIIINKSYQGNIWVSKNCLFCSEIEKEAMAFFIASQFYRTKSSRQYIEDMITETITAISYRNQAYDKNLIPRESFIYEVDKDYTKLLHNQIMYENVWNVAEILHSHIWVLYENNTDYPFYTSDSPISIIPYTASMGCGLASKGVKILFPISSKLMLVMYEKNIYESFFLDREIRVITSKKDIDYYNMYQVLNSYRCIFSESNNFELIKKILEIYPQLRQRQSHIIVS